MTLQLLWEEHRAAHPDGYGYSRFCELYRAWEGRLSPTMRQAHVAGEQLFVDYAGTTIEVVDGATGEVHACQLFVAALGASSYTYAEATWTQALADWIGSHTRAFAFFGGVPAMVVSDNLKSGITKACFYEPAVNRTYAEMAAHYDTAIVPARPYEAARQGQGRSRRAGGDALDHRQAEEPPVLLAGRAERGDPRVRRRSSTTASSRHLGASRRALFDELERPALKPLPAEPYVYAEWKQCRAGLDYHVEVEKHYYSVPHALLRETMWARITARTVELFHRGKRVAAHVRVVVEPQAHDGARAHAVEPPALRRLDAGAHPAQGGEIGPKTSALVEIILRERTHPEQGFRACIGILRHAKSFGPSGSKPPAAGRSRSARAPTRRSPRS